MTEEGKIRIITLANLIEGWSNILANINIY